MVLESLVAIFLDTVLKIVTIKDTVKRGDAFYKWKGVVTEATVTKVYLFITLAKRWDFNQKEGNKKKREEESLERKELKNCLCTTIELSLQIFTSI